jgi:predicted RNase H-like HicB family nuclease
MKREFTAIYKKEGEFYVAWIEEVPGVNTQGKTLKEAKENLKDALRLILETAKMSNEKEDGEMIREKLLISLK